MRFRPQCGIFYTFFTGSLNLKFYAKLNIEQFFIFHLYYSCLFWRIPKNIPPCDSHLQ